MKKLSPVKAIRAFCVYCMGGSQHLPNQCTSEETCPLWAYRNGKNSNRTGISGIENAEVSEATKKAREESAARFRALALKNKKKKTGKKGA